MKSLASLLLVASACATEPDMPAGEEVTSFVDRRVIPIGMNADLDVLFVIDNSPAMAAAQQKLATELRAMTARIAAPAPGLAPNVQIGVITTDTADLGQLRDQVFLARSTRFAWQSETNFDGALPDAFAPLGAVGAAGSASPRPIDLMLAALTPGVNPGFVRDDAYLAIIVLTANDDTGSIAPADAARMLKSKKSNPAKIVVTGAFGACSEGGITASAAPRLGALLAEFPGRSSQTTLCAPDLTPITDLFTQLYAVTLGLACIERIADPHRVDARLVDPETGDEVLYRACTSADDTRCYALEPHAGCLEDGSLAVVPRPWRTPFPALATLEFESR